MDATVLEAYAGIDDAQTLVFKVLQRFGRRAAVDASDPVAGPVLRDMAARTGHAFRDAADADLTGIDVWIAGTHRDAGGAVPSSPRLHLVERAGHVCLRVAPLHDWKDADLQEYAAARL